jgi:PAS domain S-box-containing protein
MENNESKSISQINYGWYERLFNNHHIGVLIVNEKRIILEVNQVFCDIFGFANPAEIVGQSVSVLHVSEKSYQHFGELVFGEVKSISTRYQFKRKDGSALWVRISGQTDNIPNVIIWTIVDIDKNVKNEIELEKEKNFSKSLIDTAQVIVLALDTDGNILIINPFLEKLSEYTAVEVSGMDFFDIFIPLDKRSETRLLFLNTFGETHIQPILSKHGREIIVEWRNETLTDVDGNIIGVLVTGQDITQRKRTECALKLSNEVFEKLTSSAKDGIVQINHKGQIVFWNQGATDIFGYSFDEIKGANLHRLLVSDELRKMHLQAFPDFLKTGQGHVVGKTIELEGLHKSGQAVLIELSLSSFVLNGKRQAMAVVRDITQRKKLQDDLRQKHKMEAVGYMAGGMAHNFNNNLAIILGNLELTQMKQEPGSESMAFLENAKIAVRRSRDLVQKIITYSRQGIQQKSPSQLTKIIDETITLLSSTLPTTINLQKNYDRACGSRHVSADQSQIQEILINLCNNAVHAMEEQGDLTISLEPVVVKQRDVPAYYDCPPGLCAKLSVQDSGCGIPADILDNIFDPFFSTKEEFEGAGMGLATVQGIVAQHKGMIKVNSRLNQGTTFELYFPVIEQNPDATTLPEDDSLPGGTVKSRPKG